MCLAEAVERRQKHFCPFTLSVSLQHPITPPKPCDPPPNIQLPPQLMLVEVLSTLESVRVHFWGPPWLSWGGWFSEKGFLV